MASLQPPDFGRLIADLARELTAPHRVHADRRPSRSSARGAAAHWRLAIIIAWLGVRQRHDSLVRASAALQIALMRINPDFDFRHLSAAQRIQLAQDLWDSLTPEEIDTECPLTAEQRAELDRRLEDLARNPDAIVSWEEARSRIEAQLDKIDAKRGQ